MGEDRAEGADEPPRSQAAKQPAHSQRHPACAPERMSRQDCPPEYGPPTTIYNRFNRWSKRGIWQKIFEYVAGAPDPVDEAALDSTHVKAHRCAGGGKGGPANRRSASPEAAATANSTPLSTNYAGPG